VEIKLIHRNTMHSFSSWNAINDAAHGLNVTALEVGFFVDALFKTRTAENKVRPR